MTLLNFDILHAELGGTVITRPARDNELLILRMNHFNTPTNVLVPLIINNRVHWFGRERLNDGWVEVIGDISPASIREVKS